MVSQLHHGSDRGTMTKRLCFVFCTFELVFVLPRLVYFSLHVGVNNLGIEIKSTNGQKVLLRLLFMCTP